MANEFIGAGWSFPLELDQTGSFALVTDEREIAQAIRLIIGTAYGERPMRPDFGCAIHDFVFAEASAATAGQIAAEVRASLHRQQRRCDTGRQSFVHRQPRHRTERGLARPAHEQRMACRKQFPLARQQRSIP